MLSDKVERLVSTLTNAEREALQRLFAPKKQGKHHRTEAMLEKQRPPLYNPKPIPRAPRKKPVQLKTPGSPIEYYCGACARRIRSKAELEAHAWSTHPHSPFFGRWPLKKEVTVLPPRLSSKWEYDVGAKLDSLITGRR